MKKILVGTDGSEASLHAVKTAAEIAKGCGAKLVLFHSIFPNLLSPAVYPDLVKQLEKEEHAEAERILAETVTQANLAAMSPEKLIVTGSAAEAMADAATDDDDVWMVVVGSRGRNAASRVLLGSVSDRLIHICKKPVLVVR